MKINNKSKLVTTRQILEIIDLLQKQYPRFKNINVDKINIWHSMWQYKLHAIYDLDIFNKGYSDIIKGITMGDYFNNISEINLYSFNDANRYKNIENGVKRTEVTMLQLIFNLIHEIRHNYQSIYHPTKYQQNNVNYTTGDGWGQQWIEKDASNFAAYFMNKNNHIISDILKIQYEWYANKKEG